MPNISMSFQDNNFIEYNQSCLTGYRLLALLTNGGLRIGLTALFEDVAQGDKSVRELGGRGAPVALKFTDHEPSAPGTLDIMNTTNKSKLSIQSMSQQSPDSLYLGKDGYSARLVSFKSSFVTAGVNASANCPITSVNKYFGDGVVPSAGLFRWDEPQKPSIEGKPDRSLKVSATVDGAFPDVSSGEKLLTEPALLSGRILSFATRRDEVNDPIPMIVRQLSHGSISLDLTLRHGDGDGRRDPIEIGAGARTVDAVLYEQLWGRWPVALRIRDIDLEAMGRPPFAPPAVESIFQAKLSSIASVPGFTAINEKPNPGDSPIDSVSFMFATEVGSLGL